MTGKGWYQIKKWARRGVQGFAYPVLPLPRRSSSWYGCWLVFSLPAKCLSQSKAKMRDDARLQACATLNVNCSILLLVCSEKLGHVFWSTSFSSVLVYFNSSNFSLLLPNVLCLQCQSSVNLPDFSWKNAWKMCFQGKIQKLCGGQMMNRKKKKNLSHLQGFGMG